MWLGFCFPPDATLFSHQTPALFELLLATISAASLFAFSWFVCFAIARGDALSVQPSDGVGARVGARERFWRPRPCCTKSQVARHAACRHSILYFIGNRLGCVSALTCVLPTPLLFAAGSWKHCQRKRLAVC